MDQGKGRPAEKYFSLLCSQANITCNKSEEDDHGWDFIAEIPMPTPAMRSADLAGEIRKCEIQVKASEKGTPVVKLSLSNARAFAKSRLPCFVVVVLDQNTSNPRVFIRHFWKNEIEQSLKRVRDAGNQGKPLNKTFTQFTLSNDEDRSPDPIGWLVNKVQSLPQGYSGEKMFIEQTIGYEEGHFTGQIRFGPMKGIEELVDHQLGLTENLPVEHLSLIETRFNVPSPQPLFEGKPSLLQMRSNATKECQLVLRSEEGSSMTVAASITIPAIPNLPPEALKLRIETWFFSLVLSNGKQTDFNFSVDFETPFCLKKLHQFLQILSWAKNGAIDFSLVGGGLPLAAGQIQIGRDQDNFLVVDFLKLVSKLLDVTERAGASIPSVVPSAILRNWSRCAQFYNQLTTESAELKVTLDRAVSPEVSPQSLIGFIELDLGRTAFVAVLEFPVNICERSGYDMNLSLAAPLIRDCFVGPNIEVVRNFGDKRSAALRDRSGKTIIEVGNLSHHSNGNVEP